MCDLETGTMHVYCVYFLQMQYALAIYMYACCVQFATIMIS